MRPDSDDANSRVLAGFIALMEAAPRASNVMPFPRATNVAELRKTAALIARRWRGLTVERALVKRASQLYSQGVAVEAAVIELADYEIALREMLSAGGGGRRHG